MSMFVKRIGCAGRSATHLLAGATIALAAATAGLAAAGQALGTATASHPGDLVLSTWERGWWALYPGMTLEHTDPDGKPIGKAPNGEPLTRITLANGNLGEDVLTTINLPATAKRLRMFIHATPIGAARHQALYQDSHGWGSMGGTFWGVQQDTTYDVDVPNEGTGWSWRVGFFHATVSRPFVFRGFQFTGRAAEALHGKKVVVEAGPIHVTYEPDDQHWLYADLQPKVIPSRDGIIPPLTLRLANLGTKPRSFRLQVQPVERNLAPIESRPVTIGSFTLEAGAQKAVPVKIRLSLLGRYRIDYTAAVPGDPAAQIAHDMVSVVNGYDVATGFRHWAAHRKWFDDYDRRPGSEKTDKGIKAKIEIGTASNGISPVTIFPVNARVPRAQLPVQKTLSDTGKTGAPIQIITTQLSPAWLLVAHNPDLTLFAESQRAGLGAPSRIAFATAAGTRVVKPGETLSPADLKAMSRPWLLAWWQGSDGWKLFDVPFLISLQHRPASLRLDENGLHLTFGHDTGFVAAMPLYGYAKLPQQTAWDKTPGLFRLPAAWHPDQLRPWIWDTGLPPLVSQRCNWWSRALLRFPVNVHESFTVSHAAGAVQVHDSFDYLDLTDDWKTVPLSLAPLSPTLACAIRNGFPMTVAGKLTDCQCATIFGPYTGIEGATGLDYSLHIGPYWMTTADPNVAEPGDEATIPRQAQDSLLAEANGSSADIENQTWDYHDGNFVWYAQSDANRYPGYLTAWQLGDYRTDRKGWLQALTLHSLLDPSRYGMDERGGTLTRRYIDGPGIGNWGSSDWGDSGKLGTDMILDVYAYAYNTGDYQMVADKWDVITSLNSLPQSQCWLTCGRSAISELGDQAPPELALARMAYAVGDRPTYTAAVYWFAKELVSTAVKEGGLTRYRDDFRPWHNITETSLTTGTNLWGTNAGWVDGGMRMNDGQWSQFPVRLDDVDTVRFMQKYCVSLPLRNLQESTLVERKGDERDNPSKKNAHGGPDSSTLAFERQIILFQDPAQIRADYTQNDAYVPAPDGFIWRTVAAWHEFPPKLDVLIPASAPAFRDLTWAADQSGYASYGMVSQSNMPKDKFPTPQWFWWAPPVSQKNVDWGDKWTFGSTIPGQGGPVGRVDETSLNAQATLYTWHLK
jgi:hypothetical protein